MPIDQISTKIRRIARENLNFSSLRPGQEEAIRALVRGRDALVVQPTGSGKSAIYQIAGLMTTGAAVVVSPLIALQHDQIDALESIQAEAGAVNSHQRVTENRDVLEKAESGEIDFLFLAPEQLRKPETLERLKNMEIGLFAVDEAHCISEWGHDFRPDYLGLGKVIEELNHPTVVALTATASPEVRDEIVSRLHLQNPQILVSGFDRPNIHLEVHHSTSIAEKQEALLSRVRWAKTPGIIYCGTRKGCEEVQRNLTEADVSGVVYHAGLRPKERAAIQDKFMNDGAEIIVATNAFGMGIDKPDIRFVFHFDIPESLDAYYQQIGRAGRDDERSDAVLFYRPEDIGLRKFQTSRGSMIPQRVKQIAETIRSLGSNASVDAVARETGLSARQVTNTLRHLEDTGAITLSASGELELVEARDLFEASETASERSKRHKERLKARLQKMQMYADLHSCRREFLLQYFGDSFTGNCGNCDNCERAGEQFIDPSVGTRREVMADTA
jgi:ATP-dependent DNA helicase RecQ